MKHKLQGKSFITGGEVVQIDCHEYSNHRLAICLLCADGPYATLTVNIDEVSLAPDEILIKNWSENEQVAKDAFTTGLFEDTGLSVQSAFVSAPIWKIK
jgi:hypothetical protein